MNEPKKVIEILVAVTLCILAIMLGVALAGMSFALYHTIVGA